MMLQLLTPAQLSQICQGHWYQEKEPDARLKSVKTDSRTMQENDLFIALRGDTGDGHDYLTHLERRKSQAALVERVNSRAAIPQLCVKNSLDALHHLARHIASITSAKKIAITGSVGKTGTKDMIAHILQSFGHVHATKGNLNNHIGLPVTIAHLPDKSDFLVTEMGMNHRGEIAVLAGILAPHIAVITNIADHHIGHFTNLAEIADAKSEIFSPRSAELIAVLPRDDHFYHQLAGAARRAGINRIISFGRHPKSTIRLTKTERIPTGLQITASLPAGLAGQLARPITFELGMRACHWAEGAVCALAVCHAANIDPEIAAMSLRQFTDLAGRGRPHHLEIDGHSLTLIDDSYNAGPASMQAALSDLAEDSGPIKIAIFTDMLELGHTEEDAHEQLIKPILNAGLTTFISAGPMMKKMSKRLPSRLHTKCFDRADDLLAAIKTDPNTNLGQADIILVKGSHGSGAHLISAYLIENFASKPISPSILTKGAYHAA